MSIQTTEPAQQSNTIDGTAEMWGALDWLVRTHAPACLDLAGLAGEARRLRTLAPVRDAASARFLVLGLGESASDIQALRAWGDPEASPEILARMAYIVELIAEQHCPLDQAARDAAAATLRTVRGDVRTTIGGSDGMVRIHDAIAGLTEHAARIAIYRTPGLDFTAAVAAIQAQP